MYCVRCGVELQKGVKKCPLCGTAVFHPDIEETPEAALYPRFSEGEETFSPGAVLFVVTFLFVLPIVLCLLIDLHMHRQIVWSGFVVSALTALYISLCLPFWFKRRNPVIFVPIAMGAGLLVALYVCLKTGGRWFLSFAFPAGGFLILLVEAVVVLCRYTVGEYPHRLLYIFGGALMVLAGFFLLLEFLIHITFAIPMTWWSLYPMTAFVLIGALLLIIASNRKLRQSLHKKLFL